MIDKPKDILFKKIFPLRNGKEGPLFNSQKELGKQIAFDKAEYSNEASLLVFLSQALKANNEKGAKPLPVKLRARIVQIASLRADSNLSDEIEEKLNQSFDFWKTNNDVVTFSEYVLIDEIQQSLAGSRRAYIFISEPYDIYDFGSVENQLYTEFFKKKEDKKMEMSFFFFFPNLGALSKFWDKIKTYFMLPSLSEYRAEKEVLKLDDAKKIRTFIVPPIYTAVPLYSFMLVDEFDYWSASDSIFSITFEFPKTRFIKYSYSDAKSIFHNIIIPVRDGNIAEEYSYRKIMGIPN